MRMYDIIQKKRDGEALSTQEIIEFVRGYTDGKIPDYQASALLMAIYLNGMTAAETVALTQAMADSGDRADLTKFGTLSVDKHSSGGVGDKTTLIVAPIVASLGGKVAKMSGRGLGHTGGTVDKLAAIDGCRTELPADLFLKQVQQIGVAVVGQSGNFTPADKKLYALRDVTATVESIPLIASSIMSKKLAAGAHNIVLDVKVGNGAFMKSEQDAAALATQMVQIGKSCGRNTAALVTDMNCPLGYAVGNALEVREAIAVLQGASGGRLRQLCVALAAEMVSLTLEKSTEQATQLVEQALQSGAAFKKFREWMAAQGDPSWEALPENLPLSEKQLLFRAKRDGFISSMDTQQIGLAAMKLGAGRERLEDSIDYGAGIQFYKNYGDAVQCGEPIATLYTAQDSRLAPAAALLEAAISIKDERPQPRPLIYRVID